MTNQQLIDQLQQAKEETIKGNFIAAEQLANDVFTLLDKINDDDVMSNYDHDMLADALLSIAEVNRRRGDFDAALVQAHRVLAFAEKGNVLNAKTRAWNCIGLVYQALGSYDKALEFFNNALSIHYELGEKSLIARLTGNIGIIYYSLGSYDMALEFYNSALGIHYELGEKLRTAIVTGNIGSVYNSLGSYDKALEFFNNALAIYYEFGDKSGIASVTGNIGAVYVALGAYDKALEIFNTVLAIHYELGEKFSIAKVTGNIGSIYNALGSYDKALEFYNNALAILYELGAKSQIALFTGNIGNVYGALGSYDKALEFFNSALAIHYELGEKSGIAIDTGNIGEVYKSLGSYDKALEFFNTALSIRSEQGDKSGIARSTRNIGSVYYALGLYDKALEFYNNALSIFYELGEKYSIAFVTGHIGSVYADSKFDGYDSPKAEECLSKAIAIGSDIGAQSILVEYHKTLADLYENEKRWEDAHIHYKKYIEIEKEVNVEDVKKQEAIRQQLKVVELAKAKADAKHQATEQLLHNVLPRSIADKMLDGTKLIAEKLPSVSVMFADIVNFTKLSQRITPEELVEGLDRIFSEFDALAEKYGLEKIKTIGDAYMVVSGAPIQREDHAEAMAQFALEMVEAMKEFRSISTGEEIQIRIGIHSGEVVAGVIGKKKFAYDLWGDAVNTASRMESHGEAGKIHVSEEFKHAVETLHATSLLFIPRGEMDIKGKGMMKTYFIEKLH